MKLKLVAGGLALLLAACGDGNDTPGQPSAEERRQIDNIAAKMDAETIDTSADSLVPAEGAAIEGAPVEGNAAASNNQATNSTAAEQGNASLPPG